MALREVRGDEEERRRCVGSREMREERTGNARKEMGIGPQV